jgi:hypothetical protein
MLCVVLCVIVLLTWDLYFSGPNLSPSIRDWIVEHITPHLSDITESVSA